MKAAVWKEALKNAQTFEETWEEITNLMEDKNIKKLPTELDTLLEAINEGFSDLLENVKEFSEELENASTEGEESSENDDE